MKIESVLLLFIICFFYCCSIPIDKKTNTIAIQPLGYQNAQVLSDIQHSLTKDLGLSKEVIVLAPIDIPKSSFTNVKSPRYRADSIIRFLKRTKPDSIDYILGFTSQDISTTKRDASGNIKKPISRYQDWGIFGLGFRPGPSCVVSNFRLKSKVPGQTLERYKKVCLHEIGHNLGLKHCPDKKCVMTDACESIKTVDNVVCALCAQCKSKIN